MNDDWKNYLLSKGAEYTEANAFHFNDDAADNQKADNTDIICDLSQYSTLVVAGEDAVDFMQGQFTNDVKNVDEQNSQLNAFCNNKGRMTANFRLFKYQNNYFFSVRTIWSKPASNICKNSSCAHRWLFRMSVSN